MLEIYLYHLYTYAPTQMVVFKKHFIAYIAMNNILWKLDEAYTYTYLVYYRNMYFTLNAIIYHAFYCIYNILDYKASEAPHMYHQQQKQYVLHTCALTHIQRDICW